MDFIREYWMAWFLIMLVSTIISGSFMARAMKRYFFYSKNKTNQQAIFIDHLNWILIPMAIATVSATLLFVAIYL